MKLSNLLSLSLLLLSSCSSLSNNIRKDVAKQNESTYSIFVEHSLGGVLHADKEVATVGELVTLTYETEDYYFLDSVKLNSQIIEGLTFEMPEEDVYIYGSFVKDINEYSIEISNSRYGRVTTKEKAKPGEKVEINYTPQYKYVLSHYLLNEENIGKVDYFLMPRGDVILEGVFVKAIADTNVKVTSTVSSGSATSYWYFSYEEDALRVKAIVEDRTPVMSCDVKHRDYVELLVTPNNSETWVKDKTFKYTVTRDGSSFVRVALGQTALSDEKYDENLVTNYGNIVSIEEKYVTKKDGYTGYETIFEIPYVAMGFDTKTEAIGNFRVAPALYNAQSEIQGTWAYYGEWFVVSTLLVINENGVASK